MFRKPVAAEVRSQLSVRQVSVYCSRPARATAPQWVRKRAMEDDDWEGKELLAGGALKLDQGQSPSTNGGYMYKRGERNIAFKVWCAGNSTSRCAVAAR